MGSRAHRCTVSTTSARTLVGQTDRADPLAAAPASAGACCASAMARSTIQIAGERAGRRRVITTKRDVDERRRRRAPPAVIQAIGNDDQPHQHPGRALRDRGLHDEADEHDEGGGPEVDERGGRHEAAERDDEDRDPEAERRRRVGLVGAMTSRVGEAQAGQGREVAADVGAHRRLRPRSRSTEPAGQVGARLERRIGVVALLRRDLGGLVERERGLDVGEVGADGADAPGRSAAVRLADGVGVVRPPRRRERRRRGRSAGRTGRALTTAARPCRGR